MRDESRNPDRETPNPAEQREPDQQEQAGMLCKPSDRNPPRERVRGIAI